MRDQILNILLTNLKSIYLTNGYKTNFGSITQFSHCNIPLRLQNWFIILQQYYSKRNKDEEETRRVKCFSS